MPFNKSYAGIYCFSLESQRYFWLFLCLKKGTRLVFEALEISPYFIKKCPTIRSSNTWTRVVNHCGKIDQKVTRSRFSEANSKSKKFSARGQIPWKFGNFSTFTYWSSHCYACIWSFLMQNWKEKHFGWKKFLLIYINEESLDDTNIISNCVAMRFYVIEVWSDVAICFKT